MAFLLTLHGEFRWLVALIGAAALIRFAVGWMRRAEFGKPDRILMAIFTGLMDLNLLMGLVLLVALPGGNVGFRMEHATMMFLAILVAHLSALARRNPLAGVTYRTHFICVALALAFVVTGVLRLRGGWIF